MKAIGATRWAIAEGYIPATSHGPEPEMTNHETACLLNAGDADAHVEIMLFFTDRQPAGPYPRHRSGTANEARPLQRSQRSRANTESDRIRERHRVGRSHCRAAHAARFEARKHIDDDYRLSRRVVACLAAWHGMITSMAWCTFTVKMVVAGLSAITTWVHRPLPRAGSNRVCLARRFLRHSAGLPATRET